MEVHVNAIYYTLDHHSKIANCIIIILVLELHEYAKRALAIKSSNSSHLLLLLLLLLLLYRQLFSQRKISFILKTSEESSLDVSIMHHWIEIYIKMHANKNIRRINKKQYQLYTDWVSPQRISYHEISIALQYLI